MQSPYDAGVAGLGGNGSGINVEENLNRLDEFHISANLHLKPARVLTLHGTLVDVFTFNQADLALEIRRQMLEPSRLQQMPLDSLEDVVVRYARCYIMYLLGGFLLPDKVNNTVHMRYLPLLANYDAISTYSWDSAVLCWLYKAMCLATDYNIEEMAGCHTLLMSWIYFRLPFWAPEVTSPYTFPLATSFEFVLFHLHRIFKKAGKKEKNDYAEQRLLRHRLRLGGLKVDEFTWMSYRDARILSRVPAKFLGVPHGDFFTAIEFQANLQLHFTGQSIVARYVFRGSRVHWTKTQLKIVAGSAA
ncbi:hypothetical protein Ahy_B09g099483 [Arachis hypogaea]|uniref:Aminotransferase-like plant mobile domain-containing protein n=1 Tax=Arachis hypogaea TaxID=3818 RepID=A0A444XTU8_ARAHY|nr:hypothetical protein Ahy_B09g099483 [Arachis hypogaea]